MAGIGTFKNERSPLPNRVRVREGSKKLDADDGDGDDDDGADGEVRKCV